MMFQSPKASRPMLTLCAAALLSAAPMHVALNAQSGLITLKSGMAQAEGSNASEGGDDSGHDGGGDHGGDGAGHDAGDNSGDGSNDDGAGHDAGDDQGNDGGGDDGGDDSAAGGAGGGGVDGLIVVKFESNAQAMEVVYSDGTKEEITNSRYERKDASGTTVEERAATQADVDRLWALR